MNYTPDGNDEATVEESTPLEGLPHVTTDPSSRIAAKAALFRISYAVRPDSETGVLVNRIRG